jgi:ubiquinol-cytochrome c reductase cytochrome b subunit
MLNGKPLTAFLGYVLPFGQMSLWGYHIEPQMYNLCLILLSLLLITPINLDNKKIFNKIKAIYRIGPHNKDVISVIFGSLLGDAYAERRLVGLGTRISFYQEDVHVEYILYLHKFFSNLGYCNPKIPIHTTRLGHKGKIRKIVRFSTFTYSSFNWIHDMFYKNNIKRVPESIEKYLTPLALAIWIMDDGAKSGKGLKFCTNSFSYNECLILIKALNNNFNIKSSVQSAGTKDQYNIYIWKESMNNLRNIVSPYIIPAMKYKIY